MSEAIETYGDLASLIERVGMKNVTIAAAMGISRETFSRRMNQNPAAPIDPQFLAQTLDAMQTLAEGIPTERPEAVA